MAALKSSKEEKFVQSVFSGKSQRQSYLDAYPASSKWKISTVDQRAHELMRKDDVKKRLDELKNAAASAAVLSVIRRKEILTDIATSELEMSKQKMQAIEILNKMDGVYVNKAEVKLNEPVSDTAAKVAAILNE